MSRVTEMISALRKCAKEHENEVVCTGQIMTSSLCKAVADYLEADRWHYPANGEYPTEDGSYFVACRSSFEGFDNYTEVCNYKVEQERWINFFGYTNPNVYAWCKLPDPPKEEE